MKCASDVVIMRQGVPQKPCTRDPDSLEIDAYSAVTLREFQSFYIKNKRLVGRIEIGVQGPNSKSIWIIPRLLKLARPIAVEGANVRADDHRYLSTFKKSLFAASSASFRSHSRLLDFGVLF